ncbi:MAG: hypothetical protein ACYS8W_14055 [Planctomycetota bacterium]|jgi:hypothetical protein
MSPLDPTRPKFALASQGIVGDKITAPQRPFPWWGEFDAVNAIGRTILLVGLWALGNATFIMLIDSPDLTFLKGADFTKPANFNLTYSILAAVICLPTGPALLFRQRWGIIGLRFVLIVSVFWLPGSAPFFAAYLIPGVLAPLFMLWSAAHIKYEFQYVHHSTVGKSLDTYPRFFGISTLYLGAYSIVVTIIICSRPGQQGIFGKFGPVTETLFISIIGAAAVILIISSLAFILRRDWGRITLIAVLPVPFLLFLLDIIVKSAGMFYEAGQPKAAMATMRKLHAFVLAFGALVIIYAMMEIVRYLLSDKVKAFCRAGEYSPPWATQLEMLKLRDEEENTCE